MKTLLAAMGWLTICYVGLMVLYRLKEFRKGLQAIRIAAFLLAWGCAAAVVAPVWKIISLLGDILDRPDLASFFEISGILVLSSFVGKVLIDHPEWHDYVHIGPFLRAALRFRNIAALSINLFEEVEKEEIRQIYRQQTGRMIDVPNAFDMAGGTKPPMPAVKPPRQIPVQEKQFAEHKTALDRGERVDLTEAYRLFIFRVWKEQEPDRLFHVAIDPAQKILSADLLMDKFHPGSRSNPDRLFRFKQDVYEEMQRINQLPVLLPYAPYFAEIDLRWFRPDEDGFGNPVQVPFCRTRVASAELRSREQTLFIVTGLEQIATIEWLGNPV